MEPFQIWVAKFYDEDSKIGNLSRYILDDIAKPTINTKEDLLEHLGLCEAPNDLFEAADKAWDDFTKGTD